MPQDKVKEVYGLISDLGYFKDENEFKSYVSDPKKRKEAFDLIADEGYFKDENEFNSYFTEVKPTEPPVQKTGTYEPRNKVAEMLNQPTSQDIQREKRGISEVPKEVPSGTKTPQMGVPVETAKKQVETEVKAKENLSQEVAFMDVQKDAEVENLSTQQLFDKNAPDLLKYLPKDKVVEYELLAKEKKLTADKQMLIERMKATNNPNTLNELNKTKVEEFKTKVEREKLQEARKKGFDAEIEKLNALATQMDKEGKTGVAKELRKSILAAEGERDGYFKDPDAQIMKIYSANKVDMDEFQVPGNTPMERTKNYALILQKQIADLDKKMQGDGPQKDGGMIEGISKVFDDQYQFFSGKKAKLEAKLAQVAPIALLNQLPTRGTDGFFNTMTNRIAKELLPEQVMARPENLTFEDIGGIIESNKLSMALSNDLITKGAVGAVDLMTEETKAFSPKWWGDLTGTSLSMMPAFIFGNKVAGAMKVPVLFDKIAVALKAQKYGKYISPFVLPAEKGIEYAAAKPFLSDDLGEEASFLSGYLGQAISGPVGKALSSAPMQAMFNKLFGASAPIVYNQIKALGGRVSSGLGEYGEEVGNTLGPILETYMNEQDFGRLKKDLTEQFGKLEPNLELFIGSVVMGMAMGSGTGIGDASLNKGREVYATLTPNQQKTADEILKQFKDDLETSEVNAKRQEIAEGETAPKVEEVTEVDLQNKQAAIEVIQSPTATIKEKAEAAKVVRDIEAKEREVAITEKALEKGPLEEGEVVKEEVVEEELNKTPTDTKEEAIVSESELNKETPKEEVVVEEVVSETPMAEETKVGELVVTDEVKDIKDEVTDEKIGEKKYQKFNIDFEDGARAFGAIENGVASISGINAPKAEGSVIEPKRGTKTYERVISKLKESGVKTISVKLQSTDSEKAIDKLVEKGVLTNPRDIMGGSFNQRPTTFDISTQETPILKEEAKIGNKIEETPQKVEEGKVAKTNNINGYEFTNTPSLKDVIVKTVPQENLVTIESDIFLTENKKSLAEGVKNEGGGWYSMKQNAGAEVFLYNDITKEGVVLTEKKGGTMGIVVQDFINNNSREATTPTQNTPSQTSLSEQKSETKVETPKKESLKQQKPKTKAEIKAEKEAEIKDRLLDRLAAYNSLSTYQQNTQKNRDEIVDIIGVASKYDFKVFDANVKSTKQSKKYELFKDGKKQTRTKVATETTKATPEQIKVAERLIEKDMVTLWDGSPYTPHLDAVSYGITWQQIRKGEQDIKAGKVDSVPARKLIEVLNQIESDGTVSLVSGSGSMMQRDGYKLSEARQAMREIPELTDADIEEINANEEALAKEYDEWFSNLTEEEQLNILEENESRNQSDVGQNVESRESQKDVPNEEDGAGGSEAEVINSIFPNTVVKQKVYHGSESKITGEFKKLNQNIDGFFFSSDIDNAKTYGDEIVEAYVNIQNPLRINAKGLKFTDDIPVTVIASYPGEKPYETTIKMPMDEIVSMVKNGKKPNQLVEIKDREKYDGVIFENIIDPALSSRRDLPQDTIVVFDNKQIVRAEDAISQSQEQALKDTIAKELNKSANELGVFKIGSTKLWLSMAKLMGLYSKKGVTKFGDFIKATGYKATSVLKDLWDGITRKKSTPISKSVRNSKLKTLNARVLFYEALIGASPLADGQTQLDDIKNTIATYKTLAIHANKNEVQDVINAVDALSDLYVELSADLNTAKEKIASQAANGQPTFELKDKLTIAGNAIKSFADDFKWQEKVQNEIEKVKGTLPDDMNPYMQKDISIGRVENTISEMTQKLFGKRYGELKTNKKSDKALFERAAKDKISQEDLDFFMYVQHAKERNARVEAAKVIEKTQAIQEAQDRLADLATQDQSNPSVKAQTTIAKQALSEAQSMPIVTDGSGMTNEEADRFMQEFEKSGKVPKLEEYAKEYRETVIKPMIDMMEEGNLLDADQAEMFRTGMDKKTGVKFDYFVPLKVEKEALEQSQGTISSGNPTLLNPIKSIKGTSKYDYVKRVSPIAQSISEFQAAAKAVEDNKTAQSLYKLVKENPNKDIWEIVSPTFMPNADGVPMNQTAQEVKDSSIPVKIDGKLKYVKINHKGLRDAWLRKPSDVDWFYKIILNTFRTYNNFKRKVLTQYSPEFALVNLIRDVQDAVFNSAGVDIPFLGKQIIGNLPKANATAAKAIYGNLDPDSDMGKRLDLYLASGGKISWANYNAIEDVQKEIDQLTAKFSDNKTLGYYGKSGFNKIVATIGAFNETVEIGTRLATFNALVDNGITPEKAASISKNMTVNFNKRGTATPLLNAAYLFSNAGIQSIYVGAKGLAKSQKARRYAAYTMLTGLAVPFIQQMMIAALSESDEEEKEYKQLLTKEEQLDYLVIPIGKGEFLRIPKSYGMTRLFLNSGQEIGSAMIDGKIAEHSVNAASTLLSVIDPITGNANNKISAAFPTALRPLIEVLAINKDYKNAPIYPEDRFGPESADYLKFYPKTADFYKNFAENMYFKSGSNIDVSPETLEYIVNDFFSGVFRTGENFIVAGTQLAQGKEVDPNKIPFKSKFVVDMSEQDWRYTKDFWNLYNNSEKVIYTEDEIKETIDLVKKLDAKRAKDGGPKAVKEFGEKIKTIRKGQQKLKEQKEAFEKKQAN